MDTCSLDPVRRPRKRRSTWLQGDLSAGLLAPELRLVVLTEEELFAKGARHKPQAKSKAATFLSSLEDLNVGDYVVHVQHGIAKYHGLKRLSVQDFDSDYLILEFVGGDKLYVPLGSTQPGAAVQRRRGPCAATRPSWRHQLG